MTEKIDVVASSGTAARTPLRLPYKILQATCPSEEAANQLDPWIVLEFFRVEALLRSEIVIRLYQKDKASGHLGHLKKEEYFKKFYWRLTPEDGKNDSLHKEYNVLGGWLALKGFHHSYISLDRTPSILGQPGSPTSDRCVVNVTRSLLIGSRLGRPDGLNDNLKAYTWLLNRDIETDKGKRYLWLRLDTAFRPHTILSLLKPTLMAMHKELGPIAWEKNGPVILHPNKRALILGYTGIRKWFNCLTCYDLRTKIPKPSFGKIAEYVYGANNAQTYERAEQSYKRFKQLIAAAESNNWPPTGIR